MKTEIKSPLDDELSARHHTVGIGLEDQVPKGRKRLNKNK